MGLSMKERKKQLPRYSYRSFSGDLGFGEMQHAAVI